MPHKHKRKRDDDGANFDLAPNSRARPLAAYDKASLFTKDDNTASTLSNKRRKSNSTKSKKIQDDAPKAFQRLMAWQATGKKPNGLDDGSSTRKSSKKQSKTTSTVPAQPTAPPATTPKILPGESLSTFSLRVDQSLPLTSIPRTSQNPNSTSTPLPTDIAATLKKSTGTTKHNKRLQRMQSDWRAEEAKLRERKAEEEDDLAEQKDEEDLLWSDVRAVKSQRKGKKKKGNGANGKDDDDPWKELEKKKREESKQKSLQDVVTAPPVLKKIGSRGLKVRQEDLDALDDRGSKGRKSGGDDGFTEMRLGVDVKDVPGKARSLRQREALSLTRRQVIEQYRKKRLGSDGGIGKKLNLSRAIMT